MAKTIPEDELKALEAAVQGIGGGASIEQIEVALGAAVPRRTLQHRLKNLVDTGRLERTGERRWARYSIPGSGTEQVISASARIDTQGDLFIPVSREGERIKAYLAKPPQARRPLGYNRVFLDNYRPNRTAYLSPLERAHLRAVGTPQLAQQAAGTYAKHILNKLLIDLSWNSSRLEGNTYSLLDTKRLIEFGEQADAKDKRDAQMIINHKEAIEFLVSEAEEIGFNRHTILNLHGILANNLLADPDAPGRLRHIEVRIEGTPFEPLAVPALIEECFDQILATAAAIHDPFEQAFFVMTQLPYLQPFDDVNKRVSRLAANIPLVRENLSPLSFIDVPKQTYTQAMLGVYELNKVELLKDLFIWGYERSASRYAAVRQSLGEPDPFRLRYREQLRLVIAEIVRGAMSKKQATSHIVAWTTTNIDPVDQETFREAVETELLALHEGNFARYRIRPSEFAAWQDRWAR